MTRHVSGLKTLERLLLSAGILLSIVYAAVSVFRTVGSRSALRELDRAQAAPSRSEPAALNFEPADDVDFGLWSSKRIHAFRDTLGLTTSRPLAVLSIPRLKIRAPVIEGTDEFALNRGLGWIVGTARPGDAGNVGIAGHRDGFFRALKDVSPGDTIELRLAGGSGLYAVDQIEIVTPDDVSVLRPRAAPSLTLVTCYPFYFVGDAPQRFIVHASRQGLAQF